MISIIVPIYNAEDYLGRCLDSLRNQDYADFEVLLINDGSVDRSGDICDYYAGIDPRFHVFHYLNCGPAAARNRGLERMRGDKVFFMDSDDILEKNALKILMDAQVHTGADLIVADVMRIDFQGREKINFWWAENAFFSRLDIVEIFSSYLDNPKKNNLLLSVWGKLFDAGLIARSALRFDENLHFCEDALFFFTYLGSSASMYYCRQVIYRYHRNQANYGTAGMGRSIFDFKPFIGFIRDYLSARGRPVDKLYGNAITEYAIIVMFNLVRLGPCCSKPAGLKALIDKIALLVHDEDVSRGVKYYEQKHKDNLRVIAVFARKKFPVGIFLAFKAQILLVKIKYKLRLG